MEIWLFTELEGWRRTVFSFFLCGRWERERNRFITGLTTLSFTDTFILMCAWWWRERGDDKLEKRKGKIIRVSQGKKFEGWGRKWEREIIITINSLAWSVSKREGAIGGRGRWFLYSKISSSSKEPFDGWTFKGKREEGSPLPLRLAKSRSRRVEESNREIP